MKKVVAHSSATQPTYLSDTHSKHSEATIVELTLKPDTQTEAPGIHETVAKNIKNYFENLEGQDASDLYQMVLDQVEPALLKEVLKHTRGNQSKAAAVLGLNRGTLRKKLKQHGLDS